MKAKLLLILILLCTNLSARDEYREYLVKWEGYSEVVYRCPSGKNTIGVGHNLDARNQPVKNYTKKQIEEFYTNDLAMALQSARSGIPNFDSQPVEVRRVVISLIFTVGNNGFLRFKKFRKAIVACDYKTAADELRDSKWWHDVAKARATDHYQQLVAR